MKAKEYFEKYKGKIDSDDIELSRRAFKELILEFHAELKEIAKKRNIDLKSHSRKSNLSFMALLNELNQKWNALCRFFPGVLIPDGYRTFLTYDNPEMSFLWDVYERNIKFGFGLPFVYPKKL